DNPRMRNFFRNLFQKPSYSTGMHATTSFNGHTVAETDEYQTVEGNIYFPPSSVDTTVMTKSDTSTVCPWKGKASYYNIKVGDKEVKDGAWYYAHPITERAEPLKDWVAFCELSFLKMGRKLRLMRGIDKAKVDVKAE
ncbi:MAG: hypothetical protein Q9174_005083, partial [Haloplaca sp. 1 TL-2023]